MRDLRVIKPMFIFRRILEKVNALRSRQTEEDELGNRTAVWIPHANLKLTCGVCPPLNAARMRGRHQYAYG